MRARSVGAPLADLVREHGIHFARLSREHPLQVMLSAKKDASPEDWLAAAALARAHRGNLPK